MKMARTAILAGAALAGGLFFAAPTTASAQGFGFSVGPGYYGGGPRVDVYTPRWRRYPPPPVYRGYGYGPPPGYYRRWGGPPPGYGYRRWDRPRYYGGYGYGQRW